MSGTGESGQPRPPGSSGGSPQVFVADEQSTVPVDVARLVVLAAGVLAHHEVGGDCELSLRFVDEDTIADLNQKFLGGAGPTDVLAFPIDEPVRPAPSVDGSGMPVLLGDVVVCPAQAERNAAAAARRTDDELALLVVHGILHVLGMDHAEPGQAAEMQAAERHLLDRFHRAGSL